MPTAIPISRITDEVESEAWKTWLRIADRPIEPSTPENASSTGTPAATKAPKAMSRIRKVIGTESCSALAKSWLTVSLSARTALASPNSAIVNPGWERWTPATASSDPLTRSEAVVASPRMWKRTSAEWPSAEIWPPSPGAYGERTPVAWR